MPPNGSRTQSRLETASDHYRSGRLSDAEAECRAALRSNPRDPDALHLLGRVLLQTRREAFAVPLLELAAAARPQDPALLTSLGRAVYAAGETEAALEPFRRALDIQPDSGKARMHLGIALLELGRAEEAEQELRAAARLDPTRPERHFYLANALAELERHAEARGAFADAIRLAPRYGRAHARLGIEFVEEGRLERASRMFAWGAAIDPTDEELRHMLAASSGRNPPARATDEHVSALFDRFAASYDEHLVERLEYRTPDLIVDVASRHLPSGSRAGLDVLDAGCGTGLCGPALRPFARRLVGVDLSRGMLERASGRGTYDELRLGEITEVMAREPSGFDLVVAADVLIYFGDLTELLRALAITLRPTGIAAVSIEVTEEPRHVLRPSGRYAHNPAHLRAAAAEAGLEQVAGEPSTLRLEGGEPVAGWISLLRPAVCAASTPG